MNFVYCAKSKQYLPFISSKRLSLSCIVDYSHLLLTEIRGKWLIYLLIFINGPQALDNQIIFIFNKVHLYEIKSFRKFNHWLINGMIRLIRSDCSLCRPPSFCPDNNYFKGQNISRLCNRQNYIR